MRVVGVLSAVVVVALGLGPLSAEVLLESGFEGPYGADGLAEGWVNDSYSNWGSIAVAYARETENAHSGAACQRTTCSRMGYVTPERRAWSDLGGLQIVADQDVPLVKGAVYHVRAWLRADVPTVVTVQLRQWAAPWKPYIFHKVVVGPEWKLVDYLGTSSVDEPKTRFMVLYAELANVWLDDVLVERVSAEDLARTVPPAPTGNLLRNGAFDLGRANWMGDVGWDSVEDPEFTIDTEDGSPCLKASYEGGTLFAITSDSARVISGRPLAVRCRMRAEQKTTVLFGAFLMHAAHAQWPYCMKEFEVGPEWQTLELSADVPFIAGIDHAYVRVDVHGAGPVWLDDAELRQDAGRGPDGRPRAAIVSDRHPFALYHDGESPVVRLLSSTPRDGSAPELVWRIEDFSGESVLHGSWKPGRGVRERRIDCSALPRGWYHAFIEWSQGADRGSNECAFCILPPSERTGPVETSPFGAHFMAGPAHLNLAKAIGARWIRLWPPSLTTWNTVEPEKGKWTFRDDLMQRLARDQGLRVCGMLESAPSWADVTSADYPAEWEQYVEQVVGHFGGDVDLWEVENEPDLRWWRSRPEGPSRADKHAEALRHSSPIVRRLDPTSRILGGCIANNLSTIGDGRAFARELIAAGALDDMDVLSYHCYHIYSQLEPLDEMGEPLDTIMSGLRAEMAAAGRELPIVNSEGGVYNAAPCITYRPCAPDNYEPIPPQTVARLLVRMYVSQIAAGVERFFYYNFFMSGSPVAKAWDSFVEGDGQPRPAVAAYAAMTWLLDGATFERTDRPTADTWVHHFRTPKGPLVVAYSRTGTEADIELPGASRLWDLVGAEHEVNGAVHLTPDPVHVRLREPVR